MKFEFADSIDICQECLRDLYLCTKDHMKDFKQNYYILMSSYDYPFYIAELIEDQVKEEIERRLNQREQSRRKNK